MTLSRRELLLGSVGLAAAGCATASNGDGAGSESVDAADPAQSSEATAASPTVTSPTAGAQVDVLPTLVDAPEYSGLAPFALGVASGDPDAESVVLWTRLITNHEEFEPISEVDMEVALDVALDEGFEELVSSRLTNAPAQHGHSIHEIVSDLDPDTWYFYRFRTGEHASPIGRTRTLPSQTAEDIPTLRFGFSSCQNWESGSYGAHRRLVEEDLDLFVWLGDYIYEYGPGNSRDVASLGQRVHNSPEVTTLSGYRARYALYKSDPALQAHHATRPWVVTWDDHEVDNNHAGFASEDDQDQAEFASRRSAAYQAWWENMPVRVDPPNDQRAFVIYRSIEWGSLCHLHMLDGRQFRSPQPTDGEPVILPGVGDLGVRQLSDTARDPSTSMLGADQRRWLENQVAASNAAWNVLGNQVYMHGLNAFPGEVASVNTDTWDGYFGERQALLESIGGPDQNLVVLSGDFHSSTAADVRSNPYDLDGPIMATEFMAPPISSTFPEQLRSLAPLVLGLNPQVRNFSPDNGYMTCEVTEEVWTTRLHLLADVADSDSAASVAMEFAVVAGQAGISSIR